MVSVDNVHMMRSQCLKLATRRQLQTLANVATMVLIYVTLVCDTRVAHLLGTSGQDISHLFRLHKDLTAWLWSLLMCQLELPGWTGSAIG